MNLDLQRTTLSGNSTIGTLSVNGQFECFTLEDAVRPEKIPGVTAIPAGDYEIVITYSEHFQRMLPLLLNVPDFEGVRIHTGNRPEDTQGCILVGQQQDTDRIASSKPAFDRLFVQLEAAVRSKEKILLHIH
ncbi:hypothetical protein GCM10027277_32670 [Pseudoduganella ginsengisoli]|uniref:DUF5675 domain-containing protein n=1 Tax=Pseudoduganella ginsengisoli TaxID=1462440 RepID=A0A6L6Q761_9BURK|nr:DUF5675 family protein [Pseudoduganella ginsengisoli]MTW05607.1 hypothetical protein [Pseudoduganella ginsengisoli]